MTDSCLTHVDESGAASMVDVSEKASTARQAEAFTRIRMRPETLQQVIDNENKKGDVIQVARIAGIQAAKRCADLIPLCHPLLLSKVQLDFVINQADSAIDITALVKLTGQTGVEMEALTAASVAALTVYDMCKASDPAMVIGDTQVITKQGGKSGHYKNPNLTA